MSNTDVLKKKIRELESMADELMQLGITILEEAISSGLAHSNSALPIIYRSLPRLAYNNPTKETQSKAIRKYQEWYIASLYLVSEISVHMLMMYQKQK